MTRTSALLGFLFCCSHAVNAGCGESEGLELFLQVDLAPVPELTEIVFETDRAVVQPIGYEGRADHQITDEWVDLEAREVSLDLLDYQGSTLVATGRVPPGEYQRVYLRPFSVRALHQDGSAIDIRNVVEPVGAEFGIQPGELRQVELQLIVTPDIRPGEMTYSIFTRDTRILR